MAWTNNYSLLKCFISHTFQLVNEQGEIINFHVPSYREMLEKTEYSFLLNFITKNQVKTLQDMLKVDSPKEALEMSLCDPRLTNLKEFAPIARTLMSALRLALPDIEIVDRHLMFGSIPFTTEIWDAFCYIYQNALGVKVEPMPVFANEKARQMWLKSQEFRKKTAEIKKSGKNQNPLHIFSLIAYRFPYTFEQLFDMTYEQLLYLQEIAAKMIAYEMV